MRKIIKSCLPVKMPAINLVIPSLREHLHCVFLARPFVLLQQIVLLVPF